jgi:endonuclease/exonuclease/phosphatase family metal-dependent hydrolase
MKKNGFVLLGIINLLSVFSLYGQSSEIHTVETTSRQLKILSWNIYMLPYLSLFNHNGRRAKVIGSQLKDSDYQIIVFQEAFSNKCRNILSKELKQEYPYQYGPANWSFFPVRTNSGLWIVSKIPLEKIEEIQFHSAQGFDRIARKGAVLFEGNFNGAKFQLVATHLQADKPTKIRQSQCDQISGLIKKHYKSDEPQILCGDFNTEMSDKQSYSQMLKILDAQNGELSGKLKVTYDEENNTLAKHPNGKGEIIDYILTRNTQLISNIKRNVVEFYHSDPKYKTHLSDHYAMEATVRLAPINTQKLIAQQ